MFASHVNQPRICLSMFVRIGLVIKITPTRRGGRVGQKRYTFMPCITFPVDYEKGVVFPVKAIAVTSGGAERRTRAALSISCADSIISPSLARKLGSISVGETDLVLPHRTIHRVPFHTIDLRVSFGMLGHPLVRYRIRRVVVLESDKDMGVGIVLGLSFLGQCSLNLSQAGVTFCV